MTLTVGQVADRLGVGVLTVREWVRQDRCPDIQGPKDP
jgi:excisionase family DNA binding protein